MANLSEKEQADILLNLMSAYPNASFELIREKITISKDIFKHYFMITDFVEKSKKEYREHPRLDGSYILEKKKSGKFEIIFQERGEIYETLKFDNKSVLADYLITEKYRNLGLSS